MILVTGGAGYIGSVLVKKLVSKKYPVRVFDSLIFGDSALNDVKEKIELIKGDIRNPPKNLFKDIRTVIHLAGLSNDPTANFDPTANYEINTLGTIKLALHAKQNKVKKFIFASSCSIYDQGLSSKTKVLNEDSVVNPTAPYSYSKFMAEQKILPLADDKFNIIVVRKGTVLGYSSRMRYDLVVNTMVKDAFSTGKITILCSGKQWRPLISVDDVVKAYLLLIDHAKNKINRQIFNVLAYNLQIVDVAKQVKEIVSKHVPVRLIIDKRVVETRSYKVSNKKISQILGFEAKEKLSDTVSHLIKKIKKNKKDDFHKPNYYNIEWMKLYYQKGKYL